MKKCLLVIIGMALIVSLSACGSSKDAWNDWWNSVSKTNEKSSWNTELDQLIVDLHNKTPLNLDDLDRISEINFPKSYSYEVYNWEENNEWPTETWEYIYPEDISHRLLLPIHDEMIERNVVSSLMNNDEVHTIVNITLEDGISYSVTYITDPDTLQYNRALLSTPVGTTVYTFNY